MLIHNQNEMRKLIYGGTEEVAWLHNNEVIYIQCAKDEFKWKATYADSHVESAECDASTSIVMNEIPLENLVSVEIGNCVTSIGQFAFYECASLTSIDIPNSVTSFGQGALLRCTSLTSVSIGSGVTTIGSAAFGGCTSLQSITCEATTPPTVLGNSFDNTNNCPIYVPAASVDAYKAASVWSTLANRIQPIGG